MIAAVLFAAAMQGAAPAQAPAPAPATGAANPPPAACAAGFYRDAATTTCVANAVQPASSQASPAPAATDDASQRVSEIHKEKKAKVNPFANK